MDVPFQNAVPVLAFDGAVGTRMVDFCAGVLKPLQQRK